MTAIPYEQLGDLPLPRLHIPTWFGITSPSENNDALLDLDLLVNENNNPMYTINSNIIPVEEDEEEYLLDMGGTSEINTSSTTQATIAIGNIPPREGSIIAYSDNSEDYLEDTTSAHVLYFKHADLHRFNFAIPHNHVINRIEKLYRYDENNNSITNLDTTVDTPDISSYKLVINSTNDGSIVSGTTKLILIEGGY